MSGISLPVCSALALIAFSALPAAAQTMNLDQFVTTANGIPMNPTSALRPSARRLMREFQGAFRAVGQEVKADRAAGRTPATCPPEKVEIDPRRLLAHLNAIPAARRARMTTTDGLRHWMTTRYPCPG